MGDVPLAVGTSRRRGSAIDVAVAIVGKVAFCVDGTHGLGDRIRTLFGRLQAYLIGGVEGHREGRLSGSRPYRAINMKASGELAVIGHDFPLKGTDIGRTEETDDQ